MSAALIVLHVIVCLFLVAVVLLQRGKGAEIGAVFGGGGSSTVFGSRGAGNFLTKLTTGSAVIFMVTSLSLSYLWTVDSEERLFDGAVLEEEAAAGDSPFEELGTVPAAESAADEFEEVGVVPAEQPDAPAGPPGAAPAP